MTNAAVEYALAQVGKPYKFAASGPKAFDCSGLVMQSLSQIGVTVPHQSGEQAETLHIVPATPENKAKLKPGDVVFWYGEILWSGKHLLTKQSITHCGLYVGRQGPLWMVVAAVDETHGVMRHRMNWALKPVGFGYVRHG